MGDSNSPGIAQGMLIVSEKSNRTYLLAGLDRYKIFLLAVGHAGASLKLPSQGVLDSYRVQEQSRHEDLRISTPLPSQPSRAFESLTNIDFGGPIGLHLGSLTRLTFHMTSTPHPIMGIEIFYADGRSVLFGSNGGCGISFCTDGSKRERINRVGILENDRIHRSITGLGGLQMSTNYGRTATFAPIRSRLNASVETIPIPPGDTITGFVALETDQTKARQKRFFRVGIQSQRCDEQMTPNVDDLDRSCHHTPDDQLRRKIHSFHKQLQPR